MGLFGPSEPDYLIDARREEEDARRKVESYTDYGKDPGTGYRNDLSRATRRREEAERRHRRGED